jgi:ABC-type lipoprotein export system ATPase subunit
MHDPAEPLIRLRNIRKIYDLGETKVDALRGVSLSVYRGEYVALMGPSGSGKSTLMNTIGCLDHPTAGSYRLNGLEVVTATANIRAALRSNMIGFVFQNFSLLARTSALENAELPLLYGGRNMPTKQRHARAREVLENVGLGDRLDHHPGQLSGGQQQRVAIARALVNRPAIIMADEPTGNLDSRTSKEVMKVFGQLNDVQGITVVLVTHDPNVARYAKRILVLRDGRIVKDTSEYEEAIQALRSTEFDEDGE